jgi:hypothetical protein
MANEPKSVATLIEEAKTRFLRKYNYFTNNEVDDIYHIAKYDYLTLKYPYKQLQDIPDTDYQGVHWVELRMVEIVELNGVSSFTAYHENGLTMNMGQTAITNGLRSLIKPQLG